MIFINAKVTLHIPCAQTLKQKRSVIKSIIQRVKVRYNVSIIECGLYDKWQMSEIGLCFCSISGLEAKKMVDKILSTIEMNDIVMITDKEIEFS